MISTNNPGTLAVRVDNTLWSWGLNTNGQIGDNSVTSRSSPVQISIPSGSLTSVIGSIAMGNGTSLAINGGLPYVWGTNTTGALGLGNNYVPAGTSSPVQLNTLNMFIATANNNYNSPVQIMSGSWNQISAGLYHTLAIRNDYTLWAWGQNTYGQVGDITTFTRSSPVQVGIGSSWINISAGGTHTVALRSNNILYAWGLNTSGQLSDGTLLSRSSPVQVPNAFTSMVTYVSVPVQISTSSWSLVSAGFSNGIATDANGLLFGWGNSNFGQIYANGLPAPTANSSSFSAMNSGLQAYAQLPQTLGTSSWVAIAAGYRHALAIDINYRLFGWGNYAGSNPATVPYSWSQIVSGNSHTLAIRADGSLWVWGQNSYGQLGTFDTIARSSPTQLGTSSWTQVAAGQSHSMAIRSDGSLFVWGENSQGSIGDNTTVNRSSPVQVGFVSTSSYNYNVMFNGTTDYITASLVNNNDIGGGNFTIEFWMLPRGTNTTRIINKRFINSYGAGTWSVTFNGTTGVLSWSQIIYPEVFISTPSNAVLLNVWSHIAIVRSSSVVQIFVNGKLQSYGIDSTSYSTNTNIYVGADPTLSYYNGLMTNLRITQNVVYTGPFTPSTLPLPSTSSTIVLLFRTGLATQENSTNANSITTTGAPTAYQTPTPFTNTIVTTSWIQVTAGGSFSAALSSTKTLYTWGYNGYGIVDGTSINRSSPVQVSADRSYVQISAGDSHLALLRTDGTVWTLGYGGQGALGNNSSASQASPVQIGAYTGQLTVYGYTKVISSSQTTYLIRGDNTLWATGYNNYGQLGINNTATPYYSPVQVAGLWKNVYAGSGTNSVSGIKVDGTIWVWGNNNYGQLATNNTVSFSSPVQLGTNLSNVPAGLSFVGLGQQSSFLQDKFGTLYAVGYNASGQLGDTTTANRSNPTQITSVYGTSSPVQISSGTSWTQVSAGNDISFATNSSNVLYFWGRNDTNQGSVATNSNIVTSPVAIGTVSQPIVAGSNNSGYVQ